MIQVEILGLNAYVQEGIWTCDSSEIEETLNVEQRILELGTDLSGSPNTDLTAATIIAEKWNGKVIDVDPPEWKFDPTVQY